MVRPLLIWLRAALAAHRSRRELAGLGDAQLADIGITRAEAAAEIARPFWDFTARRPADPPDGRSGSACNGETRWTIKWT